MRETRDRRRWPFSQLGKAFLFRLTAVPILLVLFFFVIVVYKLTLMCFRFGWKISQPRFINSNSNKTNCFLSAFKLSAMATKMIPDENHQQQRRLTKRNFSAHIWCEWISLIVYYERWSEAMKRKHLPFIFCVGIECESLNVPKNFVLLLWEKAKWANIYADKIKLEHFVCIIRDFPYSGGSQLLLWHFHAIHVMKNTLLQRTDDDSSQTSYIIIKEK